jgi:hypothetical protein
MTSVALADAIDTVFLGNGGRLRGAVMWQDPKNGVSIKLLDGSVRVVPAGDVRQVAFGDSAGGYPGPPPTTAVVVAPPPAVAAAPLLPPPAVNTAGKSLTLAGVVTLTIGGGVAGVAGALISGGDLGSGVITLAAGGTVFVVGGVIAIVGVSIHAASAPPRALSLAPWVGPGQVGATLRF